MPIGSVHLNLRRAEGTSMLPLSQVNKIDEGDTIFYAPALRGKEKRTGKVTIVLVAKNPLPDEKYGFVVLDPQDADATAEWKVPFPASLAVFVYGPNGISTGKVKGFLGRDEELIAQLANYAEKTAQTEALLNALNSYEREGPSENLNAALQGFARNYGINNRVDRTAPLDQQTLSVIRSLNPALSAYDPISPTGSARVSQTAGLATIVAGMFFGSTVGLAAGSTAMALNMKTILFPNSDFRSMYAQPTEGATTLCGKRESSQGRTRLAYLWAFRVPGPTPPAIVIDKPNNVPRGVRTLVGVRVPGEGWPLIARARNWKLKNGEGAEFPVSVAAIQDKKSLELDMAGADLKPGSYTLAADWDWDHFEATGQIVVREISDLSAVRPTAESQNRLRQFSGKQVITLEGADFEFVEKISLVRQGDRYGVPVNIPFMLAAGPRNGPQPAIEMEIDTAQLAAGQYQLQIVQTDGKPRPVGLRILKEPPQLTKLPLLLHAGDTEHTVSIEGRDLAALQSLTADGFEISLKHDRGGRLSGRVKGGEVKQGDTYDLRMTVEGYAAPLVIPRALQVAGPRPKVVSATVSQAAELPIEVRQGELPAGLFASVMMTVEHGGSSAAANLSCENMTASAVRTATGSTTEGVKLESVQAGSYFLSFDPGRWPGGCKLFVTVENGDGVSDPYLLGTVIRTPRIESFRLSDEKAGENLYVGVLTGRDLELIEKAGWDASSGVAVPGLPSPIPGEAFKQQLRLHMPWPSPAPHAPLFVWLRGESQGRSTRARY
ncbi:MAG: hypothetical protein IT168_18000 [Bryobacterales bacterium]|nr:hypothetical protein [Bryobacterales bacterium]